MRWRNDRAAATVGVAGLSDEDWIRHFARFEPLQGTLPGPLALRYHGHQFRNYNPEIGDGRGFLFAQVRDDRGRLLDLASKGFPISGRMAAALDGEYTLVCGAFSSEAERSRRSGAALIPPPL